MKLKVILNDLLMSYVSNIVQPSYRLQIPIDKAIEMQDMLVANYEKRINQLITDALKEEHDTK